MRFEYTAPAGNGWAEIAASPVDFDAFPPVKRLRTQWPLGDANVDRAAVAASLIFAPWIAGRCDHMRPFSALTAQRLVEWFQEQAIWISPTPVRSGGLQIPRGHLRLHLGSTGNSSDPGAVNLRAVSSLSGSGQQGNSVHVATNLGAFLQGSPGPASRYAMEVGFGVLLSESLSANELVHPEFASASPEEFLKVARLVESVSLGLRHA